MAHARLCFVSTSPYFTARFTVHRETRPSNTFFTLFGSISFLLDRRHERPLFFSFSLSSIKIYKKKRVCLYHKKDAVRA